MKHSRASQYWLTGLIVMSTLCLYSVDAIGDEPAEHSVKQRSHSKALTDGGTEDAPTYEQVAPHEAKEVEGKWRIQTLSLTPPGEREFRAFASGRFFDVIPDNPGGTGPIIHDNNSTKIGISQPFPLSAKDGDTFPLMLDGNFETEEGGETGPGGGKAAFAVWGVKAAKDDTPRAYFDADPVITGYSLPASESTIHAVVTVTFPDGTDMEDASVVKDDPEDRFDIQTDTQGNTIVVEVYGRKATEADGNGDPDIDTKLIGKIDGQPAGETEVIIVIPSRIAQDIPDKEGETNPQNMIMSEESIPPIKGLPENTVFRATVYLHVIPIPVKDQFGDRLNSIYKGSRIEENRLNTGRSFINQLLREDGTYSDPVGISLPAIGADENGNPVALPPIDENDADTIEGWLDREPIDLKFLIPPNEVISVESIPVYVAGHELDPAIIDRRITYIGPSNKLKIEHNVQPQ